MGPRNELPSPEPACPAPNVFLLDSHASFLHFQFLIVFRSQRALRRWQFRPNMTCGIEQTARRKILRRIIVIMRLAKNAPTETAAGIKADRRAGSAHSGDKVMPLP